MIFSTKLEIQINSLLKLEKHTQKKESGHNDTYNKQSGYHSNKDEKKLVEICGDAMYSSN